MALGFRSIGYGPEKIVALHGWLSDHQVYEAIFPYFDEGRFTIAFADFRGYGRSRALPGDWSINQMAADVADLIAALGWSRCHLIGHSMGGAVIQKVAASNPELIVSGVAITPVPASGHALDEATMDFFRTAASDDTALAEIFDALTGKRHGKTFLTGMVRAARAATDGQAFLGHLATWTGADFAGDIGGLEIPFLVITGKHDGALGIDVVREPMSRHLANVRFEAIDSAGHYPMIETPVETVDRIEGFLNSLASS